MCENTYSQRLLLEMKHYRRFSRLPLVVVRVNQERVPHAVYMYDITSLVRRRRILRSQLKRNAKFAHR